MDQRRLVQQLGVDSLVRDQVEGDEIHVAFDTGTARGRITLAAIIAV